MKIKSICITFLACSLSAGAIAQPLVIAHRGASGYLPEHTLEAKALAYAMKPDYIEQDVVMTKDDQLVVLHDHYLDRVTDVAERFPDRARKDGELIQGLNKTLGYDIGIYPEIKAPWFHRHEGKDISKAVLNVLKQYGYDSQDDKVYLQCFDANELQRINSELMPAMDMDLKLVQLMAYTDWNETMEYKGDKATPYSYDWMFEANGMKKVAEYAEGIGPWKPMLVDDKSTKDNIIIKPLMKAAKDAGLQVHPYTFRADPGRIPAYTDSFDGMMDIFYNQVKVDGLFTDFPDKAVSFLNKQSSKN